MKGTLLLVLINEDQIKMSSKNFVSVVPCAVFFISPSDISILSS